jgi:hypothetical protein
MAELKIENFKYGLDARRDDLVAQPGTLVTLNNGHINPGGEAEKRGSYTADANLYPTNTFGLQDTDTGLMTFGSDASPNAALPTGVTYQKLLDPYNPGTSMSAVLFSWSYLGKAVVIAQYITGNVVVFYNGSAILQISDGYVGVPQTNPQQSINLAGIFNRIPGWLADPNVTSLVPWKTGNLNTGYNETALNGSTLVMSPPNVHFTPTVANNSSASGIIGVQLIDQNYPGIAAVAARAAFVLGTSGVNTGDTVTVTAPAKADGTGTAQLSGGAVVFDTSIGQTVVDIVNAINNNTFLTGYSASASVNTVTVYAPIGFGNFTFNLTITTTGNLTSAMGTPGQSFTVSVSPSTITPANQQPPLGAVPTTVVGGVLTASSSGKAGTVTYSWQECNSDGTIPVDAPGSGITINPKTGPSVAVGWKITAAGQVFQGYVLCSAHDGGPPSADATRVISISCQGPS